MKKKHKHKHKFTHRNAAPRAPRASKPDDDTQRLGYTAAGAAGSALLGAFLSRQGWAPKTIAGALTAVGAGLAWKGDGATTKSLGAGTMSAAGAQLAMLMIDDHQAKQQGQPVQTVVVKKPANADGLPPGALENAFERARERLTASAYEGE